MHFNAKNNNKELFDQFFENNKQYFPIFTKNDEIDKNIVEHPENITERNTADVTNNISNRENIIEKEPDNFNNISNYTPLSNIKKKKKSDGRPKKGVIKDIGDNSGKNRNINARPKINNRIKKNIHRITKRKFKKLKKLHEPTIPERFIGSVEKNNNFRELGIYDLYIETVPKNFKGAHDIKETDPEQREKLRKEKYNNLPESNKKIIDNLIAKDREAEIYFKALFVKDFENPYFGMGDKIVKKDENFGYIEVNLDGLETYDQHFNHEYNQKKKILSRKIISNNLTINKKKNIYISIYIYNQQYIFTKY